MRKEKLEPIGDGSIECKRAVFVLMPFDSSFDDVYHVGIKPACASAGAICERVDEQIFDESILTHIYDQIASADVVVAVMTGRNPNVFYEVGYAHALGKRVILVTEEAGDIPFDLSHYPHIIYKGSIRTLHDELVKKINWPAGNPGSPSTAPRAWGVRAIYRTRGEMNRSCNECLARTRHRLDIAAFGLRSFRDSQHHVMMRKAREGLRVRILAPSPNSVFVEQREREELEVPGQIRQTIIALGEWVCRLNDTAPGDECVQLKYYDTMPLDFHFGMDDGLFIGPYLHGRVSQQTISYEFSAGSLGYQYYTSYFDDLWNNSNFAHCSPKLPSA